MVCKRLLLSTTIIVLACEFIGPRSVSGSCGDWLSGHGDTKAGRSNTSNDPKATRVRWINTGITAQASRRSVPSTCHGPGCENSTKHAPSPGALPRTTIHKECGSACSPRPLDARDASGADDSDHPRKPIAGFPLRIDHPPQSYSRRVSRTNDPRAGVPFPVPAIPSLELC
jgi:hypothetical protein